MSTEINQFQLDKVRTQMAELQEALDQSLPNFANILSDIHKVLREEPEIVTILEPEEIAGIVKGLEVHSDVTITTAKTKKKATRAKKKTYTAADL